MTKNYKDHYVNSINGKVHIDIGDHGVVLKQEVEGVATGFISLTHEEMEKLARALFAIKKDLSPELLQSQTPPPILPSFTNPPMPTNHMDKMKAKYEKAYAPWTKDEEKMLKEYYAHGLAVSEIAKLLGRNDGAIISRMNRLGL